MTTFTVSNIEERADGSAWDYGKVTIAVAGPAYDSDGHSIGGKSDKQTDAAGLATFTDLTVGVPYVWTHADDSQENFAAGSAGTFTLQALRTGPPGAGPGAVTPDTLDAAVAGAMAGGLPFATYGPGGTAGNFGATQGDARYTKTLGPSNGTDDTTMINAALAGGGHVQGLPGQSYIFSTLIIPSNTTLDVKGCTMSQLAATASNMTRNYSWVNPSGTAADGATTSGSNVVTTSLGASAVAGQVFRVIGAGGNGHGPLVGIVASATSTTITLNTLDGRPCNATATVSGAAVTLQNMDVDIKILGGSWVRNKTTSPGATPLQAIAFYGVDGYEIDIDKWSCTWISRGVAPMACRNGSVTIRDADAEGVLCQPTGPLHKLKIPLIQGRCDDDGLALLCGDWATLAVPSPSQGDIVGVDIGDVHVDSQTGLHEVGANLLKLIAGAGWFMDGVKVKGSVTGTSYLNGVWLGDDSSNISTTGGTYGDIDVGKIRVTCTTASGYPVRLWSPNAARIKIDLNSTDTAAASGTAVFAAGTSTATIQQLEITGVAASNRPNVLNVNNAGLTINQLTLRGMALSSTTNSGTPYMVYCIAGNIGTMLFDACQVPLLSNQYLVWQGNTGSIGKIVLRGGDFTGGANTYRNTAGTTAGLPTLVLDGCTISGAGRVVNNSGTGLMKVVLLGPVLSGLTGIPFFVTTGSLSIQGHLAPGWTTELVQRNASESVRVNGNSLPTDVSKLTPSTGDVAMNILNSALYGGVNCPVTWDGTSWRATRGYLKVNVATLVAGTVTVADTNITATSEVEVTMRTPHGTPGSCFVSALTAATSFTITSTSATDTSVVLYKISKY